MTIISRKIAIEASASEIWDAIANFGEVHHVNPSIIDSHITSDKKEGIGATRHCDLQRNSASIEEQITEWKEEKAISIEACKIKKLRGFRTLRTEYKIQENGEKTFLKINLQYTMKNGFYDLINMIWIKSEAQKEIKSILIGHKNFIENRKPVSISSTLDFTEVLAVN